MRHKRLRVIITVVLVIIGLGFACCGWAAEEEPTVMDVITIHSAITPAIAQYIIKSVENAYTEEADGLIILLDTPGGLDTAMRDIVKELLNTSVPVIVFVYPSGARAASAGVMITMAAHVAAMAPGTNIGAAHPVALGFGGKMDETMAKKVENDAVAYTRGIAVKKGRNAEWAEDAVRKSVSVTAQEALKLNVIDIVATDVKDLLEKIDGKTIALPTGTMVLKTTGAVVREKKMGLREKILATLSDPNIAYLLLMIGLAGLYFEFSHPGAILPGVVGGISLILAFFALQNWKQTPARHGSQFVSLIGSGTCRTGRIQAGRHDVDNMANLIGNRSGFVSQAFGPVYD